MQGYNCIMIFRESSKGSPVLFLKRMKDPYKGKFNLPGGKIERGEDGFAAAYRELAEETGITREDVTLSHMMDFTYHNQGCYVEVYAGCLNNEVQLVSEKHPLSWLDQTENFFDIDKFAGEGNIGHMLQQVLDYGVGTGEANVKPLEEKTTILCYGDSNTFGWNPCTELRYDPDVRWTGILQKMLGDSARVLEQGCNGRTTVFVKEEEPWKTGIDSLKAVLNTCKPFDKMILMLGSNDMKFRFNASPEDIADGVRRIVKDTIEFTQLKQGFVPEILVVSPCEIGEGICDTAFGDEFDMGSVEKSKKLAPLYKAVAEEFPEHCRFFDAATVIKPSEVDCLHLMPDAHQALAEAFYKII